jgi:anti-anti-sigma factor
MPTLRDTALSSSPDSPPLTVYFRHLTPDAAEIRAHGAVDAGSAGVLTTALEHAIDAYPQVTCDLSGVTYFGAAGANAIQASHRRGAARGHRLLLAGVHGTAREVLLIAGLGTMLPVPG